ncbi:Gfo/Idh/MocA family oxidoreductase [Hyphococcus flavus]|uniref:Gfo/Idh/MocA family oxidoreductase n=1 Tax=Hyphococcus flavus TaxID=1866326 RepID=A0AAE9ZJB7_9PROT|nr:Gfo/Idh/MocA family oxidoreductase [Hyphococcus flavus]WDI32121.1 Gfo/Idh/MocA family oxidoreductase [Hyphococcus flavus]
MSKRIKVGVAGAGVFGGYHASKYASHPQSSLAGIYDIDESQAKQLAEKHATAAYTDFDVFLSDIDAVVIAAPAIAHFSLAEAALRAGKHVFVEKPITLEVGEADTLSALAANQKLTLQVGHQERYVFSAFGLLARKRSPLKIDSVRRTAATGRCEDVSVALDLMIHDIDLIRHLTKSDIETLSASGDPHDASAEICLTNGTLVFLSASRRSDAPERRMTLVYDDGIVEFDFVKRAISNSTPAPLLSDFSNDDAPLSLVDPLGHGANEFIKCLTNNHSPAVTGEDGREALRWAKRIEDVAGISVENEPNEQERRRA